MSVTLRELREGLVLNYFCLDHPDKNRPRATVLVVVISFGKEYLGPMRVPKISIKVLNLNTGSVETLELTLVSFSHNDMTDYYVLGLFPSTETQEASSRLIQQNND